MAVVRTVSTNYLLFTVRCSVSALFIMYILSTVTVLIFSTGMINSKNLINDGLTSDCKNNNQAVWTYNQGVLLGGLTYLSKATGNATLIQIGQNIADATISTLVYPSGVLEELCEKNNGCGADAVTFKGVFVRYLGIFASNLSPSDPKKTVYVNWLKKNVQSILSSDKTSDDLCGYKWVGPATGPYYASVQTAAIDCLNAAIAVPEFL